MMSSKPSTEPTASPSARPVLIWNPETDASQVKPTAEQAAAMLNVSVDDVTAAIASGDLLEGWFVDWDVSGPSSSSAQK